MKRRNFILSTSAFATVASQGKGEAEDAREWIPAIDTHTHFYDPTRPEGVPWPAPNKKELYSPHLPEDFQAVAGPRNVVGTVVVEASPWVKDNDWLLELAEREKAIVGVIGNLAPGDAGFADHLQRLSANPLFRGLRLRGSMNQRLLEEASLADLKRVADQDLTIDIHGGAAMLETTLKLARRFPSLRLVVNHLPFATWDGKVPAMKEALADLAEESNVYLKVSAVPRRVEGDLVNDPEFYRPGLDALFGLFGAERLLYGSNWPASQVAAYAEMHQIVATYFATQSRLDGERYFWRNSYQAYRWVPRGAAASLKP